MASDLQLLESIASANYFIDKLYLDNSRSMNLVR